MYVKCTRDKKKTRTPVSQRFGVLRVLELLYGISKESVRWSTRPVGHARLPIRPGAPARDADPRRRRCSRFAQLRSLWRDSSCEPGPAARGRSDPGRSGGGSGGNAGPGAERAASPVAPPLVNTPRAVRDDAYGREESASECSGTGPAGAGQGGNDF